jgi:hypothetical protein
MSSFIHWRTSPRDSMMADGEDLSGQATIYDAAYHLRHIIIMVRTLD